MPYFIMTYDLVEDYLTRRTQYRDTHLRLAREANNRGELILAGALSDPADRAVLIFHVPERSMVEAFAKNDPYVINGLVKKWEVRPWTVVIGGRQP